MTDLIRKDDALAIAQNMNNGETAKAIHRAIAALPAVTVWVRKLVWTKHPSANMWRCGTMIGTYKVFGVGALPSWDFDSATSSKDATSRSAETLDAAKAAAQADYEARILAALEPVAAPDPAAIREAAIREAALREAAELIRPILSRSGNGVAVAALHRNADRILALIAKGAAE